MASGQIKPVVNIIGHPLRPLLRLVGSKVLRLRQSHRSDARIVEPLHNAVASCQLGRVTPTVAVTRSRQA